MKISDEHYEEEYIVQCTQVILDGKRVKGEIVLENSEGYFMHVFGGAFMYISKDRNTCVYSSYIATEDNDRQDDEEFSFSDTELEVTCGLISNDK